jgi:glycine oxidase
VKTWDVIVVGGGIIGLALSIALRKRGARVLVVERGEPGREASHAAGGMIADSPIELRPALRTLAAASARMYPEFVHELQDESGVDVDLRDAGALLFPSPNEDPTHLSSLGAFPASLKEREPELADLNLPAVHLKERSVDPRALVSAALKAAQHREVDISSGTAVTEILVEDGRVSGVRSDKTTYHAAAVVNCAGAWSGQLPPHKFPTRPVKGQMLAVASAHRVLHHVIRTPDAYLIPRSDGRIIIGTTVEEAGYDKRTDPGAIQRLHSAAVRIIPALAEARILEAWAGLRPGTPDALPILGATATLGYFAATGHFRDGIMLAPITAQVMAQLMTGGELPHDISAFSPGRFEAMAQ